MGRAECWGWAGDGGDGAPSSSRAALQTLRGSWCCPMAATALSAFAGLWLSSVLFSSCSSGHLHHLGSSPSALHWRHPDLLPETEPPPPPEPPHPPRPCATLCALPSPPTREHDIQLLPKPPGFRSSRRLLPASSHRNCHRDAADPSRSALLASPCSQQQSWVPERPFPTRESPSGAAPPQPSPCPCCRGLA